MQIRTLIYGPVPAILTGTVLFFLIIGPSPLVFDNIAWLGQSDPATHYLGWEFFRHSPWSWPLGSNPSYGIEIGSSVFYSDSIPLLAIFFKIFSSILPEPFQYVGLWMLLSVMLQSLFGWLIACRMADSRLARLAIAAMCVVSPPMLFRIHVHHALVGHWLILAAIYFYANSELHRRKTAWALLLLLASLIHSYLLAMVLVIWGADITRRIRDNFFKPSREIILEAFVCLMAVTAGLWQAGFFMVRHGLAAAGGYGTFRFNLLSLFNPAGATCMGSNQWSWLLPLIPQGPNDYEGFNFLGLGVILLLTTILFRANKWKRFIYPHIRTYVPLLVAGSLLTLFAISTQIFH